MYTLIIREEMDYENPYVGGINLNNLTLKEALITIKSLEEKNNLYYELFKKEE